MSESELFDEVPKKRQIVVKTKVQVALGINSEVNLITDRVAAGIKAA